MCVRGHDTIAGRVLNRAITIDCTSAGDRQTAIGTSVVKHDAIDGAAGRDAAERTRTAPPIHYDEAPSD